MRTSADSFLAVDIDTPSTSAHLWGVYYTLPGSDEVYRLMEGNRRKEWKRESGASNWVRRNLSGATPLAAHLGNPDRVYVGTPSNPRYARIV